MKAISQALVKAQAAMNHAAKDAKNPHFKSAYSSLASVIDAVRPALSSNGLAFVQKLHSADGGISVETVLIHESGEELSCGILFIPATKQDAQGFGSAISYGKRYSLQAALGIASEDDDGQAMTSQVKQTYQKPTPPPVKDIADIYTEISQATSIDALKVIANQYSRHEAIEQIKSALTARKLNLQKPSIEDSEKLLNDALFTKD
jgi:hypothetical protein